MKKSKNLIRTIKLVNSDTKASKLFVSFLDPDFRNVAYSTPKDYVAKYMEAYQSSSTKKNASLNGGFFEIVIETLLYREGILPYYTQARAAFVPNVNYDVLLYSKSEPVSLSLKTSLRERYKQADLEAIALKYVHRKSKCYLLTVDKDEASRESSKIGAGDILGLDKIVYCYSDEFDALIEELKKRTFSESEKVDVIDGKLITTI